MTKAKISRWLMLLAVVVLGGVFLFPLWQITLEAAQFPGGLRLNIWINQFSGDEGAGDIIANINILNHSRTKILSLCDLFYDGLGTFGCSTQPQMGLCVLVSCHDYLGHFRRI